MVLSAKQGQIGWMNLNPTVGHEQGKRRPVLIVSNNYFNQKNGGMVKIVPVPSNEKAVSYTHIRPHETPEQRACHLLIENKHNKVCYELD